MRRYLAYSFLVHGLVVGLVLATQSNLLRKDKSEIQEVFIYERPQSGGTGKSKLGGLLGSKSAYETYKTKSENHNGDFPTLSDQEEINKEYNDEESRPAYMKKDVLFKNYIDMTGERAIIPWFNSVEKIAYMKKSVHDRTFITTVIVIINRQGKVVKVVTAKSSGDTMMDVAVKNGFMGQEYGPPPKSLIDPDGFGRIKWVFEMHLDFDMKKNKGKISIRRLD